MLLPGGIWEAGERQRSFAFGAIDGATEQAIAEAARETSRPRAVTRALEVALVALGDREVSRERVVSLCVADRQYLMRELGRRLDGDSVWLTRRCATCAEIFDLHLEMGALPVREAGAGFPYADVEMPGGAMRFRLPRGDDQEAVAGLDPDEALRELLCRCLESAPGGLAAARRDLRAAGEDRIDAVDAALDDMAPAVVMDVSASCPACGRSDLVPLDPCAVLGRGTDALLDDVHRIASHYHWSEHEILRLPRDRRSRYLRRIDDARGMAL